MGATAMLKQLLIASLLLIGSDLCLGNDDSQQEPKLISLKSIVILPSKLQSHLQATQLSFGEQRDLRSTAQFGERNDDHNDDSFDWGFIGSGIGFNKRF